MFHDTLLVHRAVYDGHHPFFNCVVVKYTAHIHFTPKATHPSPTPT